VLGVELGELLKETLGLGLGNELGLVDTVGVELGVSLDVKLGYELDLVLG
jgi:hypothetical protein